MAMIFRIKKGAMEFLKSSSFHALEPVSIMVEIMDLSETSNLQDIAFDGKSSGIQLSWNTQTFLPSPILHIIPFFMTDLALRMVCQAKDPLELFASRIEADRKN